MSITVTEMTEIQKVPKKTSDLEDIVKSPKTILDFFKTPEKGSLPKQKSLLQFFTKTDTVNGSKIDTSKEKENSEICTENASVTSDNSSLSSSEVVKTLATNKKGKAKRKSLKKLDCKSDENTSEIDTEVEKKLNRTEEECTKQLNEIKEPGDNSISSISDKKLACNESENSVILVSDSSNIDETSSEKQAENESREENVNTVRNIDEDRCDDIGSKLETGVGQKGVHEFEKDKEDNCFTGSCSKQVASTDEFPTEKEGSATTHSDQSGKFCRSVKRTTLKGKDMMNLLKEIKDADVKDKKQSKHKHKHKHRHKERSQEEKHWLDKDNLRKAIAEKRKQEVKLNSFNAVKNQLKVTDKIKKKKLKLKGKGSVLTSITETEISDEKRQHKDGKITAHVDDLKDKHDKHNDEKEEKCDDSKKIEQQFSEHLTKKQKRQNKEISKVITSEVTTSDGNDKIIEDNNDRVKSISYEDFLKNLKEEEESRSTKCKVEKKEMSYSEFLKTVEEPMDVSYDEIDTDVGIDGDVKKRVEAEDTEDPHCTLQNNLQNIESSATPKQMKKQNKDESKSDLILESKHSGITRFFNVTTSTPDKLEKEDSTIQDPLSTASPVGKIVHKSKHSKKKDKSGPDICCKGNSKDGALVQTLNKTQNRIKQKCSETNSEQIADGKDQVVINSLERADAAKKDYTSDKTEDVKSNEETKNRKEEFLNSKSSIKTSGKTTQPVLSFGKSGLIMAKNDTSDNNVDSTKCKADMNSKTNIKSLKTNKKLKKAMSTFNQGEEVQTENDESNAFETPKNKGKLRKGRINNAKSDEDLESSLSFESNQPEEPEEGGRRRSLRNKYKVAVFQMDEDKNTPIKIKLKRCQKSNSNLDDTEGDIQTKKTKIMAKLSKAQALLEKAKKGKKKSKLKPGKIEKEKKEKAIKKKSKRTLEKDLEEEVVEQRRSSRLVGKTMPSMEEVSLEHIVILSEEEEDCEDVKLKKKKSKKTEKSQRIKECIVESTFGKESPKPKGRKTASPKKPAGKLAPIFMGKSSKSEEVKKPTLDPELAKQRMQFLMSGVPEELKKQSAKATTAVIAVDYPPLPTVSHVLQMPESANHAGNTAGLVDVWRLQRTELNYRRYVEPFCLEPVSRFTGDLINRQMSNVDLSLIKNFSQHPALDGTTEEACVGEVSCYNPSFPVNKVFASLKKLKLAAEQMQLETDKSAVSIPETDKVTVIEEEPNQKDKHRKSRLKRQKEEKQKEKQEEHQNISETGKKCINSLLWTDKYQPSCSAEVIGNSGSMKKLKNWLSEWKHVLDKEAKKARKLLMQKNKGKILKKEDDQWDDDSDFDMNSDDSDIEDTLCNTMLITGPHGCGKTSAVYALAQELGFKVHEVNASSSRNGKKILSQLQEATQSHQVSKQGCGTPSKNPGAPTTLKPKPTAMPTAFTNLFKKKDTKTEEVIEIDDKKTKKRKREANDSGSSPKKKRSKKSDNTDKKAKTLTPTFLDIDESSNGMIQGLNLSSTTMILFDEVDVVFDDDKGFLAAVQTFMATTKIPIVMTTTSQNFTTSFEGRYETVAFKQPPVISGETFSSTLKSWLSEKSNEDKYVTGNACFTSVLLKTALCIYLQLISLLEGLRLDSTTLSELLQLFKCDIRKCLLSLQFISETGGSLTQTLCSVAKSSTIKSNNIVHTEEKTVESFQDSQDSAKGGNNPNFEDDDDDFVILKPRISRQRMLIEDDNSNSVDVLSQAFSQKATELVPTANQDEDAKLYPCVHKLGADSLVGLTFGQVGTVHEIILRNMKMPTITNLLEICQICEICQTFAQNLMSNNLSILMPLATKVVDHMISSGKDEQNNMKKKKRRRIQTDLYDSETSNDAADCLDTATKDEDSLEPAEKTEQLVSNKEESRCSVKALSAFSRFYDTMGMLDVMKSQESLKVTNSVKTLCGKKTYGSVQPGLVDDLPKFNDPCDLDCEVSRCYGTEVEVRSVTRLYQEIDRLQGEIEQLCNNNPAYSEDYVLPVRRGNEKFTLLERSRPSQPSSEKRAEENIVQNLPLFVHNHHRPLQLDYLPTLRDISRMEYNRHIANTKRRFQHYFDSITLPLRDTTLNILTSTFPSQS